MRRRSESLPIQEMTLLNNFIHHQQLSNPTRVSHPKMSYPLTHPCLHPVMVAAHRPRKIDNNKNAKKPTSKKIPSNSNNSGGRKGFSGKWKEPAWRCVEGCGACCKLAKGSAFPTPEEIFTNPSDIELYRSLIGPDGWCIHYEKSTRKCSIYPDRPYFCRVEPEVFHSLYGINKKYFNKEANSSCRDTITEIYGHRSEELDKFNNSLRSSDPC